MITSKMNHFILFNEYTKNPVKIFKKKPINIISNIILSVLLANHIDTNVTNYTYVSTL